MNSMLSTVQFVNSLESYESADLSFRLFNEIDFSLDQKPKSFYRADFRRSKITNCQFFENIFGRADFVDVYIENSTFENVNWGSCLFKNSYIISAFYHNNSYRGVSLQFNTFKQCVFKNEKFIFNAYKTQFIHCVFENCTFEKSSLEDLIFESCEFNDVNIAECHAEKLKFNSCRINKLKLGVTYWSTYLYKNTKIEECLFMYKGNIVNITDRKYFVNYIDTLLKQNRLYEFLNCIIINNRINRNVTSAFCYVMKALNDLPEYIRDKNMADILDMLEFYFDYSSIGYDEYSNILAVLNTINWELYSFDKVNMFISKIYQLNRLFDSCSFSIEYLNTINLDSECELIIHLDFNDEKQAIHYVDALFLKLNALIKNTYNEPLYTNISVSKGSIILTVSSFLLLGVLLTYVYKKAAHNTESVKFERALSDSLRKKLTNEKITISEIKKICSVAKEYNLIDSQIDEESIKNLSNDITKGEIISLILKVLS